MKVLSVVGARPQFIKAAILSRALANHGCDEIVVHSGQHYDYEMSEVFFKQLELVRPKHLLDVGSGSHAYQTGEIMKRVEPVMIAEEPDIVLVFGDTNTTVAAALAAAKLNLRLAHIEAGLRSFNRTMPEEVNRIVADHASTLLFAPTKNAVTQLAKEGITDHVHMVGDLMTDLAIRTKNQLPKRPEVLHRFGLKDRQYAVATVHRASNTDTVANLVGIVTALRRLRYPVIFPVHPRTAALANELNVGHHGDNIVACKPQSYMEMIALLDHARVVLTDSGGIQKEAFVLGVPCVTLREETEWPETLEDGWNTLAGSDTELIVGLAEREAPKSQRKFPFGSGRAAEHIAEIVSGKQLVVAV